MEHRTNMSRTVAVIQARMSSSRFPNKVLEPLGGLPMIVYMVRRARRARTLDEVVVATSVDTSDDPLAEALGHHQVPVLRGDLNDVLARYEMAAESQCASVVVRLTGDCPLIDPTVIDAVVARREETGADYSSNIDPPTFPDGLDVECFTRAALARAFREASAKPEREHVTLWMRSAAAGLSRVNQQLLANFSHLRLTVDHPDDLAAVRRVVSSVSGRGDAFDVFDILRVIDAEPDIMHLNPHARNEGLTKSLAEESKS
jgi:spore coat polysaccharide biosynthesis protein SpsF